LPSGKTVFRRCERLHCELPIIHPTQSHTPPENSPYIDVNQVTDHSKQKSTPTIDITHRPLDSTETATVQDIFQMTTPSHPPTADANQPDTSLTSQPQPLPVDRANSALPKVVTMSQDDLFRSIGFLHTGPLLKHISKLGNKSVQIQSLSPNPTLDPGSTASIRSWQKTKQSLEKPQHYGDVWHVDIGFGPCTAICGIKYTLLFVNKSTRFKFVYGLKNLTSSLHSTVNQFLIDCGMQPKTIRTDFDQKLIGGKTKEILTAKNIKIEASPPYRQHQNGLVERHWQTTVSMACNWLRSSLLPSKFWYLAVKRACEVTNMLPINRFNVITSPFEAVYKKKVDYRNLFLMFSVAYIRQMREDGTSKLKWINRSLKCIVVGQCPKSDGLLFYHPPSKQMLSCSDGYKFDSFTPAGPQFKLTYDGRFIFNTKASTTSIHRPPTHEQGQKAFILTDDGTYKKVNVLSVPVNKDNENYVVQETESGDIHELESNNIFDHDPSITPAEAPNPSSPFPHITWLKHNCKATMYLKDKMQYSQQGRIKLIDNKWKFFPGHKGIQPPIELTDFEQLAKSLIENKKLFQGWKSRAVAMTARRV
jgi:hypothetical protein